jgi:2-polyprenyl-6-methoxyphenol hydroxylase-like FAD-dependent oxidoreductase
MGQQASDVVIVGGGPVGMGLAIELGQRGVSCVVIERYAQPQPIPKGQNLTQRTMEHFHCWGVEKAVRAASPIPVDFGIGGLTAYGTLLGPYHYDWYQRVIVRPYYFRDNERLPQYDTEAALGARAAELPEITTLYGWTAQEVTQDAAGVTVTAASADGQTRQIRAQYAVGCDGARSLVREQAGITQTSSDHESRMALLVFRSKQLNELLAHFKGKSFFNVLHPELDGYWQFFGRVDTGETWFFHAPVPVGTTRENFDFHAYLEGVVGAPFDCDFKHIGFWDLRVAVADNYGAGRLFIAGDAAHSHPPYGGYGINTGFEDARNLGWKLAATLQGWATPGLLATYSEERQPVFVSTARDFIVNYIEDDRAFLRAHDPQRDREDFEKAWAVRASGVSAEIQSFEPNYESSSLMVGAAGGATGAVGSHSFKARAGHHLAPQILSGGRNVFEELGAGFTLLAFDAQAPHVAAFEAAAKAHSVPLKIVYDTLGEGRGAYEARLVLVRPDAFVAFAGDAPAPDAATIFATAIGG